MPVAPASWKMDVMPGAQIAVLDHEVRFTPREVMKATKRLGPRQCYRTLMQTLFSQFHIYMQNKLHVFKPLLSWVLSHLIQEVQLTPKVQPHVLPLLSTF